MLVHSFTLPMLFWFLVVVCFVCGFAFVFCLLLLFVSGFGLIHWIVTAADYVQVPPCQFTFCAPFMAGLYALMRLLSSVRHATERVERPGESQLALDFSAGCCVAALTLR